MSLRRIEHIEVIVDQFHLGTFGYAVAHSGENIRDLVQHSGQRMLFAKNDLFAGEGHIDGLFFQLVFQLVGFGTSGSLFDGFLNLGADLIGRLADDGPFLSGQLAHAAEDGGQFAFFAQVFHTGSFQAILGISSTDLIQRLYQDLFQLFSHVGMHSFM